MVQEILSVENTAKALDVTVQTLIRWRKAGKGPRFVTLSERKTVYLRSDLDAWLHQQTVDPKDFDL